MIDVTDYPNGSRLNNAIVIGELASPECADVLSSKFVCGFARNAPEVPSGKWHQIDAPFGDCLKVLTNHPCRSRKEGPAVFFNETELTGETDGDLIFCYRTKRHTRSVTAFALDIDGTDSIERVRQRIIDLGLFAVLYTTYSHAEKASADGDYFRVILPLRQPFCVSDHGTNMDEAARVWTAKYLGFCDVLGCSDVDRSAAKFVQMMYLPRRSAEAAPFRHDLLAGRALELDDMPAKPDERGFARSARTMGQHAAKVPEPVKHVRLSDGFDVRAWFNDIGRHADVELLLDALGWEVRNHHAGDGLAIRCPNEREHSNPDDSSDQGCWACRAEDDAGFVITCHHNHCDGVHTWNFVRLLEDRIREGEATLPDGCETLSELLCADWLYPDAIDGAEIDLSPADYRVSTRAQITALATDQDVTAAFGCIQDDPEAGDDDFASLFAGVEKAGNKIGAAKALRELVRRHDAFTGNDFARLKKHGTALLANEQEHDRAAKGERQLAHASRDGSAHPSMDIADALGDTLPDAIATLTKRWRPVSIGGKFCVARIADENALTYSDATLQTMSEADFKRFHMDRRVRVGDDWVNPAEQFLHQAPRCSGIEFAPPPTATSATTLNLYAGRSMKPVPGDSGWLKQFIHDVVCNGRTELFQFVWLWMAHLVQRPGEKPGTAIVLRGLGGTGKSSFGRILERLCAPYSFTLADQEHVTGRFAGAHLAVCLVAVCTESLFAGDPRINGKLKNLVTAQTTIAEAKGLPVVQVNSFTRFFFDSNNDRVVPIDGDGSERRYLVMEISDSRYGDKAFFDALYRDIEGDGIEALLADLLSYDPSADGLDWSQLRIAPDTEERRLMRWHSMRPVERALLKVFEDGELTIRAANGETYRYVFEEDEAIRIPTSELNDYLRASTNRYEAKEGDVRLLMESVFGTEIIRPDGKSWLACKKARGRVDALVFRESDWAEDIRQATHFFEFPPLSVLRSQIEAEYQRKAA